MASSRTEKPGQLAVGAAATGAIGAALAATACCVAPLVLGILGVGGAGALALIRDYRTPLLVATVALLGVGFLLAYRRRVPTAAQMAADPSCGCETPASVRMRSVSRTLMWASAVTVAGLLVVPMVAPKLMAALPAPQPMAAPTGKPGPAQHAVIKVGGVNCDSCAIGIERALMRVAPVSQFALNVPEQIVKFSFAGDPALGAAFTAAIRNLGYQAQEPVLSKAQ